MANPSRGGWSRHGTSRAARPSSSEAITDKQEKVALQLPYAGPWMVNLVHMIPASDSIEAD